MAKRIRTKVIFSGVPAGTTGTAELERDGGYKVTWDLPGRSIPLVDWFDKEEYAAFLEEV